MDPGRVEFLFGEPRPGADLADEHTWWELLRADRPDVGERMLAVPARGRGGRGDPVTGPPEPSALRTAIDLLQQPELLEEVAAELLGEDDPGRVAAVVAVAAEREGRLHDAEAHLRAAAGHRVRTDDLYHVALHEGGWFARFLADRGPLLPPDEAALAATWLDVPRLVHEVVEPAAGSVRPYASGGTAPVVVPGLGGWPGDGPASPL